MAAQSQPSTAPPPAPNVLVLALDEGLKQFITMDHSAFDSKGIDPKLEDALRQAMSDDKKQSELSFNQAEGFALMLTCQVYYNWKSKPVSNSLIFNEFGGKKVIRPNSDFKSCKESLLKQVLNVVMNHIRMLHGKRGTDGEVVVDEQRSIDSCEWSIVPISREDRVKLGLPLLPPDIHVSAAAATVASTAAAATAAASNSH